MTIRNTNRARSGCLVAIGFLALGMTACAAESVPQTSETSAEPTSSETAAVCASPQLQITQVFNGSMAGVQFAGYDFNYTTPRTNWVEVVLYNIDFSIISNLSVGVQKNTHIGGSIFGCPSANNTSQQVMLAAYDSSGCPNHAVITAPFTLSCEHAQ